MDAINPATGEIIAEFVELTPDVIDDRLQRAKTMFRSWRTRLIDERASLMNKAADVLDDRSDEYALLITKEMGKPINESRAEVEKCAWVCRYYAEHTAAFLEPETVETDGSTSMIRFDPLGPLLAIMPWNFPLWQVFRMAAPALMAGNCVLLKHAPNVPGCALACEEVFREAGFPLGVFQTLLTEVDNVEGILLDTRVRGVALTGSVGAGSAVGELAGRAIKPVVLELGGSDPFIVLADADLDAAADGAIKGRFLNCGQSCIAAKRIIVEESIYDTFVERLHKRIAELVVGDPQHPDTQIGPMARGDLRDAVHDQVRRSIDAGATLRIGGAPMERPGFFYAPTLLTEVQLGMPAFDEEVFGPVAVVIKANSSRHAIELANHSDFGLGASVWTKSPDPALAARLEAGAVFFNGIVKSDPRLPFGGVKNSGVGRELARIGQQAFLNIKSVWVA